MYLEKLELNSKTRDVTDKLLAPIFSNVSTYSFTVVEDFKLSLKDLLPSIEGLYSVTVPTVSEPITNSLEIGEPPPIVAKTNFPPGGIACPSFNLILKR